MKFNKMPPGQLVRWALICAVQDRETYADCHMVGSPERLEALDDAKQFRAYLKKRFGVNEMPGDAIIQGARMVDLKDIPVTEREG